MPRTSSIMLLSAVVVMLMAMIEVRCNPVKNSSENINAQLEEKLTRLKELLEDLTASHKATTKPSQGTPQSSSPDVDNDELNALGSASDNRIINMKKVVETLSPEEIQKLKEFQILANSYVGNKNENEGTFKDTIADDSKENADVINWRELARRLQERKQTKHSEDSLRSTEPVNNHEHIEAETVEGSFGPFRDEIKYSLEKNLLTDIALAVHSGISMEEIVQDLLGDDTQSSHE